MFTGLVQKVGKLGGILQGSQSTRLTVLHDPWDTPLITGESIAVQGVCLSVVSFEDDRFVCDMLHETWTRTAFRWLISGARLNLERALILGSRIGGHIVTGHVDGTGEVSVCRREVTDYVLRVNCTDSLLRDVVFKGSIALDGVSLTVSNLTTSEVEVRIIPHTWENTCLKDLSPGRKVNVETDTLSKYVRRHIENRGKETPGLTMTDLSNAGFL